jgi:hypothetical protein
MGVAEAVWLESVSVGVVEERSAVREVAERVVVPAGSSTETDLVPFVPSTQGMAEQVPAVEARRPGRLDSLGCLLSATFSLGVACQES